MKEMENIVQKGWQKCGIDRAFISFFQLKAMEANATMSLFTISTNIEDNVEDDDISYPT